MINIVKKYLDKNHYTNQKESFEELFLSHPNYPSVFAITDSLEMLSIENVAVKVPKEQFVELPDSFLAIFNQEMCLVNKNETSVSVETEDGKKKNVSFNEFLTGWDEIVIVVEPNEKMVSKNISTNTKWLPYVLPVIALIGFSIVYNSYTLSAALLLLTSVIGLLISVFIIQEKLGIKNEMVSKLCNINSNTSCDSVIKSDKGNNNKWVNFSDLPLLFFGISVMSIVMQPIHSSLIVGFLSLFSIPVIVYSIWLQKFQLKKWCVLCLAISGVILIQSFVFGFSNDFSSVIFQINFFGLAFSTVLVISIWMFLKPVLENQIKSDKEIMAAKKFKRNFKLFQFLSKKIPSMIGFKQLEGLQFGNKNADVQLTIIISPSCGHCHKAFEEGFELLSKFPERVFLHVLFNINPENEQNPYKKVVESLLAINNAAPENRDEAISDWHIKKMTLEEWKEKWTLNVIDMKVNQQIHEQYNWCLKNEFNYTPVKIINDALFPNEYEISDLKYFLHDFSEEKRVEENALA